MKHIGTPPERRNKMNTKSTRQLTKAQKQESFNQHQNLIILLFAFGNMMLRKQLKRFCQLLYGTSETETDFAITELILNGFLIQKNISRSYKTQMLYISKYPRNRFYENIEKSGDIPALNFSRPKLLEQIFKIDYILDVVIPAMQEQNFKLDAENILTYLTCTGNNLLYANNQTSTLQLYHLIGYTLQEKGFSLTDDFFRDMEIASYDKTIFEMHHRNENIHKIPSCPAKEQRDREKAFYSSKADQDKYYYHLGNFHNHRFFMESIKDTTVQLAYFDSLDSLDTRKLYTQLAFILLMFQRYTNDNDIAVSAAVYVWNDKRRLELMGEETKQAFDFKRQETLEESKKEHILQSIGILPSKWENIQVQYQTDDIYGKYHIEG